MLRALLRQRDFVLPIPRTLETQGFPSLDLVISSDCPSENEILQVLGSSGQEILTGCFSVGQKERLH